MLVEGVLGMNEILLEMMDCKILTHLYTLTRIYNLYWMEKSGMCKSISLRSRIVVLLFRASANSLPKSHVYIFDSSQFSAWHLKWAILPLSLILQMSIGRKWKEIIDVNDKITYNFHVKPVLINFDWLMRFINIYDSNISGCHRMILEPKEQQRVDTPYKQCWSIFGHLCWKACSTDTFIMCHMY